MILAAIISALVLSGCMLGDRCPLDGLVAAHPVALDLNPIDHDCSNWQSTTTGPGSLDVIGCVSVDPVEALSCGYEYHLLCETPDGLAEIWGDIELRSVRRGVEGEAWVEWLEDDGETVWCSGKYAADAWPIAEVTP